MEGNENKQNILTWLNEEKLIQRVLSLLSTRMEEALSWALAVG